MNRSRNIQNLSSVKSCNILLFSFLPDGTTVLLLARTAKASWVRSSQLYSDLGGRRERNESIQRAAAREFMEESLGVVPIDSESTIDGIQALLQKNYFYCCCTTRSSFKNNITYLIYVPFCPHINSEFNHKKKELMSLESIPIEDLDENQLKFAKKNMDLLNIHTDEESGMSYYHLKKCCKEKDKLVWVSTNFVLHSCTNKNTLRINRISFLHQTRIRLLSILPIIENIHRNVCQLRSRCVRNTFILPFKKTYSFQDRDIIVDFILNKQKHNEPSSHVK